MQRIGLWLTSLIPAGAASVGLYLMPPHIEGLVLSLEVPFLTALFLFGRRVQTFVASCAVALVYGLHHQIYVHCSLWELAGLFSCALFLAGARCYAYTQARRVQIKSWRQLLPIHGFKSKLILATLAALVQQLIIRQQFESAAVLCQAAINVFCFYSLDMVAWPLIARPQQRWRPRLLNSALPVAGVFILGVLAYLMSLGLIEQLGKQQLKHDANRLSHTLRQQTQLGSDALIHLQDFFDASHFIDRQEFGIATQGVLERRPALISLQWVPLIAAAKRPAFEAQVQQEGLDFKIYHVQADGLQTAAQERDFYYPILYSEPQQATLSSLGMDLSLEPVSWDLIKRAKESEGSVVSPPIQIKRDGQNRIGYLQARYVHKHAGVIIAAIGVQDLLQESLKQHQGWSQDLSFSARGQVTGRLVYQQNITNAFKPWSAITEIKVGDRGGILEIHGDLRKRAGVTRQAQIAILLFCLGIAALTALITIYLNTRRDAIVRVLRDRAHTQRKLAISNKQLGDSQRLASLGGMVAGITHEVHTPLNVARLGVRNIEYCAQRLLDDNLNEAELKTARTQLKQSVSRLSTNLDRAVSLINDFKQVSADRSSNKPVDVELGELMRTVTNLMQAALQAREAKLEFSYREGLILRSRPGLLSQALVILIDNALKHAFSDIDHPRISLQAIRLMDTVEICCKDNGVGIPEELHSKIFESFFTTKGHAGGTGLGLYLAKTIVHNQLGGSLELKKTESGSNFVITLPI